MKEELCATCGDSKHFHKKQGCQATYKMGTEWCDCTKFVPKTENIV